MVTTNLDKNKLAELVDYFDPAQTLLYVPDWRAPGYDRDYPNYQDTVDEFGPFIEEAHRLGFRVMPHMNYFGVDPLHPAFDQFEPYQIRSPWGDHAKQWWLWERADPTIRFAYINPAYKPWRDYFIDQMVRLHERYGFDAIYLDQTLVIMNDHNGLIGGQSMIDGNIALHQELREALPDVPLGGEGLNEVTYRHEAFAQRHAFGIDFVHSRWDMGKLDSVHPIASYLFRPYTIIYGYLGYVPPRNDQMYAAWNEAYQHYGVIPTLMHYDRSLRLDEGFMRQLLDEAAFWQQERPVLDLDRDPWPDNATFLYRTADGDPVVRTRDRRLLHDGREIIRTLYGKSEVEALGSVPGWRGYSDTAIIGLDPYRWYPYQPEPPDRSQLHVTKLPPPYTLKGVVDQPDIGFVRFGLTRDAYWHAVDHVNDTITGSRWFEGGGHEQPGPLRGDDGATFYAYGDTLHAHPPYDGNLGTAYMGFPIDLENNVHRFVADVALAEDAVGPDKSDGAIFSVAVIEGDDELARAEQFTDQHTPQSLELDLRPFAGLSVTLELEVHPGPDRLPNFDWARWYNVRIERDHSESVSVALRGMGERSVIIAEGLPSVENDTVSLDIPMPSGVCLVRDDPKPVSLPLSLVDRPYHESYVSDTGIPLKDPLYGYVGQSPRTIAGQTYDGFRTHPPDQGRVMADFPMVLPSTPAQFQSYVGLPEEAQSTGVLFRVEVNGKPLVERFALPEDGWQPLEADLTPWAGKPMVLSLVVDSMGRNDYDWADWGAPQLVETE